MVFTDAKQRDVYLEHEDHITVKEKIIAAKRDGFTHVCAPYGNRDDLIREPDVLKDVEVTWVKTIQEVLSIALI